VHTVPQAASLQGSGDPCRQPLYRGLQTTAAPKTGAPYSEQFGRVDWAPYWNNPSNGHLIRNNGDPSTGHLIGIIEDVLELWAGH